ncbi:MAG: energy-coupling factor ABC transporter permease [Phycisphaerales bacterium]|nr:energy-coupling factor ABC transporter permease [Phycisphaerales bacterium]
MHIPDGLLDVKTAVAMGVLSATGLGVALRHVRLHLPAKRVPLLGLSAAFVFAAQMLNFPVLPGVSGHLIGGMLTAALLGPSAAVVVISAVLIVQCFLLADGGVLALGANIFNMALVGSAGGWVVYYLVSRAVKGLFGRVLAATFASWVAVVVAAVACAGALATSGTASWSVLLPMMTGVHMLIGVGEGVITAMVLTFIAKTRPEMWGDAAAAKRSQKPEARSQEMGGGQTVNPTGTERWGAVIVLGLLICVGLALFVGPFACGWDDGLEVTVQQKGVHVSEAAEHLIKVPMPDYKMPGLGDGRVATGVAGAVGTVVVFGLAWVLARSLVRKMKPAVDVGGSE